MKLFAITLFAPDLGQVVEFYEKAFELKPVFTDDTSALFQFETMYVNVIRSTEAVSLIAPGRVAAANSGFSNLLTIQVKDVDAEAQRLAAAGIELLNGPINQPWGIRALIFSDPSGQAWEFSQPLESAN